MLFVHQIQLALQTQQPILAVLFAYLVLVTEHFTRISCTNWPHMGCLAAYFNGFQASSQIVPSLFIFFSALSESHPVVSGVPQGAIISIFLFDILLSDLSSSPGVTTYIYADDIVMYVTADAQALLETAMDDFAICPALGSSCQPTEIGNIIFYPKTLCCCLSCPPYFWCPHSIFSAP